jgi:hypothetical protein
MKPNVQDYVGKRRDTKKENQLSRDLRQLPPEDAFAFVWEYLDHDPLVGLALANRCLRSRAAFEKILTRGFEEADASSIRWWLERPVERIGAHRALALFRAFAAREPAQAWRLVYWLRIILGRSMPALVNDLDALGAALERHRPAAVRTGDR